VWLVLAFTGRLPLSLYATTYAFNHHRSVLFSLLCATASLSISSYLHLSTNACFRDFLEDREASHLFFSSTSSTNISFITARKESPSWRPLNRRSAMWTVSCGQPCIHHVHFGWVSIAKRWRAHQTIVEMTHEEEDDQGERLINEGMHASEQPATLTRY
jgi:hypothetical protein